MDQPIDVLCEMNLYGTCTWVSNDTVTTEFDPFFIVAYGYQDQTDAEGNKHFIWMTLAGAAQSLTRTFSSKADAIELLGKIRILKRKH